MKEKIAIDIDDVLSASAAGFTTFSNEQWGTTLTADHYSEEWAVVWGCSLEEAERRSELFHTSGVVGKYAHLPQALPVLQGLVEVYDLAIVTSRRSILRPETDSWLDSHFKGLFKEVHYAGMWDDNNDPTSALNQTKADICTRIGAAYLIDDQLKHCIGVAERGVRSLLFGEYRWNELGILPADVTRVANWSDVARYFNVEG